MRARTTTATFELTTDSHGGGFIECRTCIRRSRFSGTFTYLDDLANVLTWIDAHRLDGEHTMSIYHCQISHAAREEF
jgi:hypothetical protein